MIKVQPAESRIAKSESPDCLKLTYPPKGLAGSGGFLLFMALVWFATMVWVMMGTENKVVEVGAGFLLIPAVVLGCTGLAMCVDRWSLERTATTVVFTRGGLWGSKARKWPAEDVSSFWVDVRKADAGGSALIIGFRNGRSEELLAGSLEEDFQWIAAIMKDPRGERRPLPSTARAAAEPVPRRTDASIEPATVVVRKYSTGVEMTFLPLLDVRWRWWKLLASTILGVAGILTASSMVHRLVGRSYPPWIPRVAAAVWLLLVISRFTLLRRFTVIQVLDGLVTIAQNQGRGNFQFPVEEVEFVQTFGGSEESELQFLLRGKPKIRVLRDRPPDELEWAARYLRVAIRGRAPEEAAAMKMETAAGECQVCGEKMESRVIFCAKCRTPHHEECWSYVGQCSTFACREIRFTRT
jgi:hypothetical protein